MILHPHRQQTETLVQRSFFHAYSNFERTYIEVNQVMQKTRPSDAEYLLRMYKALPPTAQSRALQTVAELLVMEVLPKEHWVSECDVCADAEQQVWEEISERLTRVKSNTFAAEVLAYNTESYDIEDAIFPDGRAEIILIADAKLADSACHIFDTHEEMEAIYGDHNWIRPSDYSQPREDDPDEEYDRQINDFTDMVRDWRHDFITTLLNDCYSVGKTAAN